MEALVELSEAQRVVALNPNDLPGLWDQLEPLVEKACDYSSGDFSPQSVIDGVFNGALQMFAYAAGQDVLSIAVTSVTQQPDGERKLEILLVSGENMRDWVKFQEDICAYAKDRFGCSKARAIVRKGLTRVLADWKQTAVVLEREID